MSTSDPDEQQDLPGAGRRGHDHAADEGLNALDDATNSNANKINDVDGTDGTDVVGEPHGPDDIRSARSAPDGGPPSDAASLQILVELAAHGDLPADEVAEVESLIANKPHLRSEYKRLRSASAAPPPAHGRSSGSRSSASRSSGSGCFTGMVAFGVTLIAVLAIGIFLMNRAGGETSPSGTDAIDRVIESSDQKSLTLEGPRELTAFDRLALIYSSDRDAAVLLGADIPTGGELFAVDDPDTLLATFDAGTVRALLAGLDPDRTYAVRPVDSAG